MTYKELLQKGSDELFISLTDEQLGAFSLFLTELKRWNEKINLTAIIDDRDIVIKHVLDSLSYLKGFTPAPGLRLLDIGSGAGFPALPLKIARPELSIAMVDSVKKKAAFLRHIVRTLKLKDVEVFDVRTEHLPASLCATFDVVTARAFASMGDAVMAGLPFLKPGGVIVLSRGPEETIPEKVLARAGVTQEAKIALTLPHSDYKRAIWVFKKPGQ